MCSKKILLYLYSPPANTFLSLTIEKKSICLWFFTLYMTSKTEILDWRRVNLGRLGIRGGVGILLVLSVTSSEIWIWSYQPQWWDMARLWRGSVGAQKYRELVWSIIISVILVLWVRLFVSVVLLRVCIDCWSVMITGNWCAWFKAEISRNLIMNAANSENYQY